MVRLYTIQNCSYCSELKGLLEAQGINFIEIDVNKDENQEEYKKIHEMTKSDDVPLVKVGERILVPNISFFSIKEAAELTKKFLV
jgi:glutaredoxin